MLPTNSCRYCSLSIHKCQNLEISMATQQVHVYQSIYHWRYKDENRISFNILQWKAGGHFLVEQISLQTRIDTFDLPFIKACKKRKEATKCKYSRSLYWKKKNWHWHCYENNYWRFLLINYRENIKYLTYLSYLPTEL